MTSPIKSCWIITDGKAGDEGQCIGVAEALGVSYEVRRVTPRKLFTLFMPRGPIDPKDRPGQANSPLSPPFPDLAIASGRRAVPYLRYLKKHSKGHTFTVFLKDPRTGADTADLIWVQAHDPLRGANVLVTATGPHRFSAKRLEKARQTTPQPIADAPSPRIAVLVGGNSRHHKFSNKDCETFAKGLETLIKRDGATLMITASRRTPEALVERLRAIITPPHQFWDGQGENPLIHYLANADAIVATADSTNMIGEATATGKPIHVFHPGGGHRKIDQFLGTLEHFGVIHPFPGPLKTTTYEPLDSTPLIANAIRTAISGRFHDA